MIFEKLCDLGKVPKNSKKKVSFKVLSQDIPFLITKLEPACGCTEVKWNPSSKVIEGSLSTPHIPIHLNTKEFNFSKSIKVTIDIDGKEITEILTIKGISI